MKRRLMTLAAIAAAALTISAGKITVFAAGHHSCAGAGAGSGIGTGSYCRFADEDGDGVCDNAGTYCRFVDEDGDGVCDNFGTHHHNSGRGNVRGKGCHR